MRPGAAATKGAPGNRGGFLSAKSQLCLPSGRGSCGWRGALPPGWEEKVELLSSAGSSRRARRSAGNRDAAVAGAMEEFHPHNDEMTFNTEEAHSIIKDCIEGVLGKADYDHDKVNQWTAAIVEQSLTHLVKLGKTYKYIVTCAVMQKCGAGLHTASSCFWDTTTDGTCTVRWENRTMNCVVNVFAVAIIL